MASFLHTHHLHLHLSSSKPHTHQLPIFSRRLPTVAKPTAFTRREYNGNTSRVDGTVADSFCCLCKAGLEIDKALADEGNERPPFDINLAVILAGFAFEAYSSPPIKYETFEEIDEGKKWWMRVPIVSEFLRNKGFEPALKKFVGSDTVQARQFAEYSFGQLKSFNNNAYLWKSLISSDEESDSIGPGNSENSAVVSGEPSQLEGVTMGSLDNADYNQVSNLEESNGDEAGVENGNAPQPMKTLDDEMQSDKNFWKKFASEINQNVVEKFGIPIPEKLKWDGFDLLDRVGAQSRKIAEATYVESGLATPEVLDVDNDKITGPDPISIMQSSFPDLKEAARDLLKQTDSVLGILMVLTASVSQAKKEENIGGTATKEDNSISEKLANSQGAEEMKALFSTAETAMEAWAMLATSLGHPSFIKSEFEKLCFLDNETTDTGCNLA